MAKTTESDKPFPKNKSAGADTLDEYRGKAATLVRIVFIVFAVVLALGAFLVAVRDNVSSDNGLVKLIWHFADAIDGPFSRDNGIFKFAGKNAETKDAVVNWGIAAIVYLVISNIVQRLLRPTGKR
jgi:hypothetical protein